MSTTKYGDLSEAMADAERIEAAHKRVDTKNQRSIMTARTPRASFTSRGSSIAPMELGNTQSKKITPAEREMCIKEGRCFVFCEKGHSARFCPKGR